MKLRQTLEQMCVPMLVGSTCLAMSIVTSCQMSTQATATSMSANMPPAFAMRVAGDHSLFDLPPEDTRTTSSEDLFRLVDVLDQAYAQLDFAPPYPRIRIVDTDHSRLKERAVGVAAVTDTGESRIYLNRQYLRSRADLLPLVLHELAHLKAWRVHGFEIETHGPEFMQICRAVTARRNCTAKEG
ncbi:MAG: SprT-like domain-containing protein [Pseudomonadota bacterium]